MTLKDKLIGALIGITRASNGMDWNEEELHSVLEKVRSY